MPHARYKVKCALCKKTFDNDNSGGLTARGSIQTTHRGQYYGPGKTSEFSYISMRERFKVGYWSKFQNPQFLVDFAESWHTDRNLHADFKSVIKIPVS